MNDWTEDGQHLTRTVGSQQEWMAHCCSCGMGVEELPYEPPVDYLCDECLEGK